MFFVLASYLIQWLKSRERVMFYLALF
jgi:hypothetical protein